MQFSSSVNLGNQEGFSDLDKEERMFLAAACLWVSTAQTWGLLWPSLPLSLGEGSGEVARHSLGQRTQGGRAGNVVSRATCPSCLNGSW